MAPRSYLTEHIGSTVRADWPSKGVEVNLRTLYRLYRL
jgi:hypothetical protein